MTVRPGNFNDILSRFPGARQRGALWTAPCNLPGHKTPAGHITLRDAGDKALITCQGGKHSYGDFCQWLGFDSLAYSPNGNSNTETKIIACYDYKDNNGRLLYQVVRYEPKAFRQRRPDGKGGWLWNLKGVKPVLYRLPEIVEAIKQGHVIYICEGEKDVDNLVSLGLSATTNSGGAGKWKAEYSETLKGASVVIIPDRDVPGQKHASQVANSLQGKAKSLKVLVPPDINGQQIKDIGDWLAAGGTLAKLETLVNEAPEYGPQVNIAAEVKTASFISLEHYLYEQIYSGDRSSFVEYNCDTGEVSTVSCIMRDGIKIVPLEGEEVVLGAVKLPSDVTEYSSTLSLLEEIEAHIYNYLDISQSFGKFAAYYILLSWLYDRFNTLPYLRALGDTGCGKSRFLDVIGGLCYKPTMVSGCITAAPIYRMLKRWSGTMILDEADLQHSDEYNEVVKILNCGFERGRPVIRATKDNPDKLQFLPTFGPKVFATRRRFKDAALEARCLTEVMEETTREDIPATLTSNFHNVQQVLRNKLLLFRFQNYHGINAEEMITLDLKEVEPRLKQISTCFGALFAGQPDVLKDYMVFLKNHQKELIEQRALTPTGRVMEVLFNFIESHPHETLETHETKEKLLNISAGDIAEKVNMEARTVGQILKTLGLRTKAARVSAVTKRCIIYDEIKLDILKKRYIPVVGDVSNVTCVSSTGGSSELKVAEEVF